MQFLCSLKNSGESQPMSAEGVTQANFAWTISQAKGQSNLQCECSTL